MTELGNLKASSKLVVIPYTTSLLGSNTTVYAVFQTGTSAAMMIDYNGVITAGTFSNPTQAIFLPTYPGDTATFGYDSTGGLAPSPTGRPPEIRR